MKMHPPKIFSCNVCNNKVFSTKGNLTRHVSKYHPKQVKSETINEEDEKVQTTSEKVKMTEANSDWKSTTTDFEEYKQVKVKEILSLQEERITTLKSHNDFMKQMLERERAEKEEIIEAKTDWLEIYLPEAVLTTFYNQDILVSHDKTVFWFASLLNYPYKHISITHENKEIFENDETFEINIGDFIYKRYKFSEFFTKIKQILEPIARMNDVLFEKFFFNDYLKRNSSLTEEEIKSVRNNTVRFKYWLGSKAIDPKTGEFVLDNDEKKLIPEICLINKKINDSD
jgi:hypothetical protein